MKILFIGVYRDGGGYSEAASNYILALDSVDGIYIVPRPLKLNNFNHPIPPRIQELEGRSSHGCDVVIEHCLPHQFSYDGRFAANVGLYASETDSFPDSVWGDRINLMDQIWVINNQMLEASRKSGVIVDSQVVPHTINIEKFMRSYQPLEMLKPYRDSGSFIFYFIGELVKRKNLPALLRAFHTEFDPSENVDLVIKTSQPGVGQDELRHKLSLLTTEIKNGLKLHGGRTDFYKKEIFITERLTDYQMMRLHAACDCFVMPSYGEAWNIPAFTSMAMGKTSVVTACTGFLDYLSNAEGWLVPARLEPVYDVGDTFVDLFTGNENWWSIDILELRKAMREAFANHKLREQKALAGLQRAHDFSYHVIGNKMKGLLNGLLAR